MDRDSAGFWKRQTGEEIDNQAQNSAEKGWATVERDGEYMELLGRPFEAHRKNNHSLGQAQRVHLPSPILFREGKSKIIFAIINAIALRLNRPIGQLTDYLVAELGTTGSIDALDRLVLKGKFDNKQFETVVKRYGQEYVACRTCRGTQTGLGNENRVWMITCES